MEANLLGQVWRRVEACRRMAADEDVRSLLAEAVQKLEAAGRMQRVLDEAAAAEALTETLEDVPELGGGS